jgi:hypothetical protein
LIHQLPSRISSAWNCWRHLSLPWWNPSRKPQVFLCHPCRYCLRLPFARYARCSF